MASSLMCKNFKLNAYEVINYYFYYQTRLGFGYRDCTHRILNLALKLMH